MDNIINNLKKQKYIIRMQRLRTMHNIHNYGVKIFDLKDRFCTLEKAITEDHLRKVSKVRKACKEVIYKLGRQTSLISKLYDQKIQQYQLIKIEINNLQEKFDLILKKPVKIERWYSKSNFIDTVVLWCFYRKEIEPTKYQRLVRQTHKPCLSCLLKGIEYPCSVSDYYDLVCHLCSQKTLCSENINTIYKSIKQHPEKLQQYIDQSLQFNLPFSGV